jgi:hypothetical protein
MTPRAAPKCADDADDVSFVFAFMFSPDADTSAIEFSAITLS